LASRTGAQSDWKAYFTAGRAAYELNEYEQSRKHFVAALEANANAPNAKKEIERCEARIREETDGSYDFLAMTASVTLQTVHVDVGSFLNRTIVKDSPHHGRGLFAACDIKAGELIYCEKATCLPNQYNIEHNSAALYACMVELGFNNPSVHRKMLELYGGNYERTGKEGSVVDGVPVLDVFLLETIRRKNCFSGVHSSARASRHENHGKEGLSRGLWRHAAYVNHACLPNSNRSFIGDMLISVATTNIKAGTELSQIYQPPKAVFTARAEQFRNWGFVCGCALCDGEKKSPMEMHAKRYAILADIEAFIIKRDPQKHWPDSALRTVEKWARQLEEIHEPEIYGNLPRLTLVWPSMWLVHAYRTRKNHGKTVKWALHALRNFGFLTPLKDGAIHVYKDEYNAVTTFEVVKAMKYASDAYSAMGQKELAAQALGGAKLGFKTLMGFENDLSIAGF
jgi:hypothetical protein